MIGRRGTALVAVILVLAGVHGAGAAPIPIPNHGFEQREEFDPFADSVDKYLQYGRESWRHFEVDNNGGPVRIWNPGDPANPDHLTTQGSLDVGFGGNAPEGKYVAVVRSRYNDDEFHEPPQPRDFEAAVQVLTNTFNPNLQYTLSAQVGRLPGSTNYTAEWYGYALQIAVGGTNVDGSTYAGRVEGGTVIAQDWNSTTVTVDTFATATATYVPHPSYAALEGEPLQIRLAALEHPTNHAWIGWVAFDAVTLDESESAGPTLLLVR